MRDIKVIALLHFSTHPYIGIVKFIDKEGSIGFHIGVFTPGLVGNSAVKQIVANGCAFSEEAGMILLPGTPTPDEVVGIGLNLKIRK